MARRRGETMGDERQVFDDGGEPSRAVSRLFRNRTFLLGLVFVVVFIAMAAISLVWTPYPPGQISVADRLLKPGQGGHLLGTDQFGRDVLSLLMAGARSSLLVGLVAAPVAIVGGVAVGALASIRGGWVDEAIMRGCDVMYTFPTILIALILTVVMGAGIWPVMVAVAIQWVPVIARVCRGASMQVMALDFVAAARSYGRKRLLIYVRHVIPNISAVIIVQGTVLFGVAILVEAALSYLGLGTQPPLSSWGRMLSDAQNFFTTRPLLPLWPGLSIVMSVLGLNLMGDGLRDVLDPKLQEAAK